MSKQDDVVMLVISSKPIYASYVLDNVTDDEEVENNYLEEWLYSDDLCMYVSDLNYLLEVGDYRIHLVLLLDMGHFSTIPRITDYYSNPIKYQ